MKAFAGAVDSVIGALDAAKGSPNAQLSRVQKQSNAITMVARLFELFLRIHPYANGNGHAGRLIVVALLGRSGFWLRRFAIEPRPPDPPYSAAIVAWRDGNPQPLEQFIADLL